MGNPKPVLDHEPEAAEYARRKAGLSQAEAARRLGVARSLISQIESGARNATEGMLLRMAEVYNCPVVVLERKRHPVSQPEPDRAVA